METDTGDVIMEDAEDGEIEEEPQVEVDSKRERHVSDSLQNSFSSGSLDEEKLKKRAERFGVQFDPDTTNVTPVTKEQMKDLYQSLDLPEEELTSILENDGTGKHAFNHRFEAIHLRGTEKMNTQDVFDYFKGYAPATIEWINDFSCNIVWLEPWQAARAMLERSTQSLNAQPKPHVEGESMDHEEAAGEPLIPPIPTPPGVWRLGYEYPKATALIMRFANRGDRKIKGAERLSQFYKLNGNPNFDGVVGLISSSRKRRMRGKDDPPPEVDSKNPWGTLAEAWGAGEPDEIRWEERLEEEKRPVGTSLPNALVRRLGHQPPRPSPSRSRDGHSGSEDSGSGSDDSDSQSSQSSNTEEGRSRKKRPRMRMYADDEEEKERKKKLQSKLKEVIEAESKLRGVRPVRARLGISADISPTTNSASTSGDLRQRLGSSASKNLNGSGDLRATLTADDSDDDRPTLSSTNHTVDLRSKLKSRLGAK